MNTVYFDYETRSEIDLKKTGAYEYAIDDSTETMCLGYKINDNSTKLWTPDDDNLPYEFIDATFDDDTIFVAHNASFEYYISKFVLPKYFTIGDITHERLRCTMSKAAACSLPMSLEGAGAALGLKIKKDKVGHKLMLKHTKPRTVWRIWDEVNRIWIEPVKYHDHQVERLAIYDYCLMDVEVTYLLDKRLPDLIPNERKIWLSNLKMNERGIKVDTRTIHEIYDLISQYADELNTKLVHTTGGSLQSTQQIEKTLQYLRREGFNYSNLQAATIDIALDEGRLTDNARSVLEIRKEASKASNKKYVALASRANKKDGRVRDLTIYHGASTGREAGRGIQIQNFPRGKIKDVETALDIIKASHSIHDLEMFYKSPSDVFSSCLRSMIIASEGYKLFVADYNAIEARVTNWLADNRQILNYYINGVDLYKKMASIIFNKPVESITDVERFVGKQAILGCGYGMGWRKFKETCASYGRDISDDLAQKTVNAYREVNKPIVQLWYNYENAAINAVVKPGKKFCVNKTAWFVYKNFLWCELPSGRRLAFHEPSIRNQQTPWGQLKPSLYYWRTNPKTKKWENTGTYGGSLVESVSQATARDITVNCISNVMKHGYEYMFQVHDEIICEHKQGDIDTYIKLLTDLPKWGEGLPLSAEGWTGDRYKK